MGAYNRQPALAWRVDEDIFVCPDGSCVSAPHEDEADEVKAAGDAPQPAMMAPPRA